MLRIALALAAFVAVSDRCSAGLSIIELQPLAGGGYTDVSSVNDRGDAVGTSAPDGGSSRAVVWHGAGSGSGGNVPQRVGPNGFSPGKINNGGQIAGNLAFGNGGYGPAVAQGDNASVLPDPRNGYGASVGSINDAGKVTGTAYRDGRLRAVTWQAGQPRWLPDWGLGSHAGAVNTAGAIAGDVLTDNGTFRPVVWGPADSLRELPVPSWGVGGSAGVITDAGLVAGTIYNSMGLLKPVVWTDVGVRSLPLLTVGWNGTPWAANEAGLIVGSADDADGQPHAVLWQDGHVRDLNDLLPADSGWRLTVAADVNESGQIVGQGYLDGQPRGYLLDLSAGDAGGNGGSPPPAVPLPAAAGMVLCAGPLLWVGRRVANGR